MYRRPTPLTKWNALEALENVLLTGRVNEGVGAVDGLPVVIVKLLDFS